MRWGIIPAIAKMKKIGMNRDCLEFPIGVAETPFLWYDRRWTRGRVVEGARLEIVWAEMSRRFESSRFRQNPVRGFFVFNVNIMV